MNRAQDRYTDSDLLKMLQIIASDYNRLPTQREILADNRLPTHHTYRNRFGTLTDAFMLAGLIDIPKTSSTTHGVLLDCIKSTGMGYEEWVNVGSIVVDFVVTRDACTHYYIDVVDIGPYVADNVLEGIVRMRMSIADAYRGNSEYVIVSGPLDAVKCVESIA